MTYILKSLSSSVQFSKSPNHDRMIGVGWTKSTQDMRQLRYPTVHFQFPDRLVHIILKGQISVNHKCKIFVNLILYAAEGGEKVIPILHIS